MSRLRALAKRYFDRHFRVQWGGCPLPGPAGHLDRAECTGRELRLAGWSQADSVTVRSAGHETATAPGLLREDVAEARGIQPDVGFELRLPEWADDIQLTLTEGAHSWTVTLPKPSPQAMRLAWWRVKLLFLRDLLKSAPHLPRALLARDSAARTRVKSCLRLDHDTTDHSLLETRLFETEGLPQGPLCTPITIVMPVYDAFDMLGPALDHVSDNTDLPWHLVLIEDASPDPRVRPFLRAWAAEQGTRVTLLENDENLGFIGSVNRAFAVALERGDHVVLLNSDAFVPPGWASRLIRPILRHACVASVTPMSNDATIMTAPIIAERHDLEPGTAFAMDTHALRFNPEALLSVLPTGVGFCMAINIAYLARVPRFDPEFGRGYGEEVDWCQRVQALGGRHLGLPSLFVEHRGGGSFGSAAKRRLIRRNNQIVSQRYPNFDARVQAFLKADPMATARLALGMAQAGTRADWPIPIYIAHFMGGGAEHYVRAQIKGDLLRGLPSVVLRVGGPRRWRVELHTEMGVTQGDTDDFDFIETLLAPLGARQVIYSCAVGDSDPITLPSLILRLVRDGTGDRLDVLMHDYFALSPSYTLLNHDLTYYGPVPSTEDDRAHRAIRPNGHIVSLAQWRAQWGQLLRAAHRVTVFSDDSRKQVLNAYPFTAASLKTKPHAPLQRIAQMTLRPAAPDVIGVLGAIGEPKGAAVVTSLATQLQARPDVGLVLIGSLDPKYDLPRDVTVTGEYKREDVVSLAEKHGVTRWLIPSIWPETFSYTTHEALATGLPVHAFDIGAQGEAVAKAPNGIAVRFDPNADLVARILASITEDRHAAAA